MRYKISFKSQSDINLLETFIEALQITQNMKKIRKKSKYTIWQDIYEIVEKSFIHYIFILIKEFWIQLISESIKITNYIEISPNSKWHNTKKLIKFSLTHIFFLRKELLVKLISMAHKTNKKIEKIRKNSTSQIRGIAQTNPN